MVRCVLLVLVMTVATPWPSVPESAILAPEVEVSMASKLHITVARSAQGKRTFIATLADTPVATAFMKLLPLSVKMEELNGNEKFISLASKLPTRPSRPASIRTGDVMLYGSDTLVLFYKSFRTTFSYTSIAQIDDPAGLEAALGSQSAEVTFESAGAPR